MPLDDAEAGMKLAAPVTHPEHPEQELLKRGYVLESTVLPRLRELGIEFIYVDYPGLDDLDRHLAPCLSPARQAVYSQVKHAIIANQRSTHAAVSYSDYYSTTRDLIMTLLGQGQHPIYMDQMSRLGNDAVGHATAVAHLSLLLGIKLERYLISQRKRLPAHHAKEVVNLGVAGMLHDMGKLKLPSELQHHTGIFSPEDEKLRLDWEHHSRLGYEMVHDGIEPSAAIAVLHHHQHFDGTGFPAAKHKDGSCTYYDSTHIHIFARIIHTVDLYDRLSAPMRATERRSNLEILHLMRTQYVKWMDPVVFEMLQTISPPFPPGSIVGLSDSSTAVVVDVQATRLYQPIVRRRLDDGKTIDENRLDLSMPGAPTIVSVCGKPVAQMLPGVTPPTPAPALVA